MSRLIDIRGADSMYAEWVDLDAPLPEPEPEPEPPPLPLEERMAAIEARLLGYDRRSPSSPYPHQDAPGFAGLATIRQILPVAGGSALPIA